MKSDNFAKLSGILLLFFTSFTLVIPSSGIAMTMGDALNKAGRQRMLSQRIAKAYALRGQKLMLSAAIQLDDALTLFEKQMAELTDFAQTDAEKTSIKQVAVLWESYRTLAISKPTKENAIKLSDLSEDVLAETHKFVLLLEQRSATQAGHLVNISGRQRMLSQRIAKFYALKSWGLKNPEYDQAYNKAIKEFTTAMVELKAAPENTADINTALTKVERDWKTFKIGKKTRGGRYLPSLVARSLDKILGQMNHVTALYAALNK